MGPGDTEDFPRTQATEGLTEPVPQSLAPPGISPSSLLFARCLAAQVVPWRRMVGGRGSQAERTSEKGDRHQVAGVWYNLRKELL